MLEAREGELVDELLGHSPALEDRLGHVGRVVRAGDDVGGEELRHDEAAERFEAGRALLVEDVRPEDGPDPVPHVVEARRRTRGVDPGELADVGRDDRPHEARVPFAPPRDHVEREGLAVELHSTGDGLDGRAGTDPSEDLRGEGSDRVERDGVEEVDRRDRLLGGEALLDRGLGLSPGDAVHRKHALLAPREKPRAALLEASGRVVAPEAGRGRERELSQGPRLDLARPLGHEAREDLEEALLRRGRLAPEEPPREPGLLDLERREHELSHAPVRGTEVELEPVVLPRDPARREEQFELPGRVEEPLARRLVPGAHGGRA